MSAPRRVAYCHSRGVYLRQNSEGQAVWSKDPGVTVRDTARTFADRTEFEEYMKKNNQLATLTPGTPRDGPDPSPIVLAEIWAHGPPRDGYATATIDDVGNASLPRWDTDAKIA